MKYLIDQNNFSVKIVFTIALFLFILPFFSQRANAFYPAGPATRTEFKISVVEVKTGKTWNIAKGSLPKVLPFSGKIVFSSPQGLSITDQDGKNEKLLIKETKPLIYFTVSPDGKKIAAYSNNGGNKLIVTNSDGTGDKKIFDMNSLPYDPFPVLSPKSDKVLFINGCDLAIIDTDGSNFKVLKASDKTSFFNFPKLLPDNDHIIFFEEDRDKKNNAVTKQIKVMSLISGKETIIGNYNKALGLEVAANGFILIRDYKGSVTTRIIDSNKNFKVIYSYKGSYDNSISPDGKYIISCDNGSINIRDIDGKNKKTIVKNNPGTIRRSPVLTSDGKYIIYHSTN